MKAQGLNTEEILAIVKRHGAIGRHKFKWSNTNINKKLRRLVREGALVRVKETRDFCYYGLPAKKDNGLKPGFVIFDEMTDMPPEVWNDLKNRIEIKIK